MMANTTKPMFAVVMTVVARATQRVHWFAADTAYITHSLLPTTLLLAHCTRSALALFYHIVTLATEQCRVRSQLGARARLTGSTNMRMMATVPRAMKMEDQMSDFASLSSAAI